MDIAKTSALDLSAALHDGTVTAPQVMAATLDRIDQVNPEMNAIVSLRDRADLMAEAEAAQEAAPKGWMHGIPIAVKDLANAAGLPTSMGSPLYEGQMAEADDLHIGRLRAAGAIVIGKTNTPEFGLGSQTFNPVFGATKNPYDTSRTCGGSSGGAAVALATGMLSVADGSDSMGSLRNPAAWNNVYGLRPSLGLVPSEPKGDMYLHQISTNGPMARSPRDLAALLDTMAGLDPRQPAGLSLPMALPEIHAQTDGRKIGWLADWGGAYAFEPGILEICSTAMATLSDLGLDVENLAPPMPAEVLWEPWKGLRNFAIATAYAPLYENGQTRDRLKAPVQWEIENGLALSAMDVHHLSGLRSAWYRTAAKLFETFDALALPATQVWPFPVETDYPTEIAGHAMDTYHRWMEVMLPASLIGLPAVCIPVGFDDRGLPMGVQLIGPRGGDARLLQIAETWHQATDWPGRRPG